MRSRTFVLTLVTVLSLLIGCGPRQPRTYSVEGRVAFANGEVVKLGTVEFRETATGTVARGKIEPDGSFQLTTYRNGDGAIEGTHQAIVQQLIISEDLSFRDHDHGRRVPRKYASYKTSDLQVKINPVEKNAVLLTLQTAK
jgi:hypothetical protein